MDWLVAIAQNLIADVLWFVVTVVVVLAVKPLRDAVGAVWFILWVTRGKLPRNESSTSDESVT